MKWVWLALGALALLVVLVAVVGALLPRAHVAARRLVVPRAAAEVFALVSDVAAHPSWRSDVRSVTWLPDDAGRRCFREVSRHGAIDLAIERVEPERLFVTRIVTRGSPFTGTWTVALAPAAGGGGTEVTVTEHGEVHNVIFRALARFVFGHTATIDGYLRALAARCGSSGSAAEPGPAVPAERPAPR
jgi:hypothetical protein